jgi:hypothetical protein
LRPAVTGTCFGREGAPALRRLFAIPFRRRTGSRSVPVRRRCCVRSFWTSIRPARIQNCRTLWGIDAFTVASFLSNLPTKYECRTRNPTSHSEASTLLPIAWRSSSNKAPNTSLLEIAILALAALGSLHDLADGAARSSGSGCGTGGTGGVPFRERRTHRENPCSFAPLLSSTAGTR